MNKVNMANTTTVNHSHWRIALAFLLLVSFTLTSWLAQAAQKQTHGNWDIHYSAFNSTFLTPEIAKNYGVVRSKYNAVLNISVLDNQQQAQRVVLQGTATNLAGQRKTLTFRQVKRGKAIYYLAQLKIANQETLRFNIDINQSQRSEQIEFSQKFYTD